MRTWKVLIVDDDPSAILLLKSVLSQRGFEVLSFLQPSSALEGLKTEKVDLVISDLKMPEMDGIRFMTLVKEMHPLTPVILFTGNATLETAVSAMQRGAFDYLKKPYDVSKIHEVVVKALESAESR